MRAGRISRAVELRNSVRALGVLAEPLLRDVALDARARDHAQSVMDGVRRLSVLIEELQTFPPPDSASPVLPLNLESVVAGVLQDLEQAIRTNGAVVTVDPLPLVRGNGEHLASLFQNLLGNSIKYRSNDPPLIHVSTERHGPDWLITVRDNGVGIARERHEEIFSDFKRPGGYETAAKGIGLRMCRKIIESTGGAMWVESEPGAGAVFCFTLSPAIVAPTSARNDPASAPRNAHDMTRDKYVLKGIKDLSPRKLVPPIEIRRKAPVR